MNEFERAREAYESIPIPQELNDLVRAGIRQGKANYRRNDRVRKLRRAVSTLAACFAVMFVTLNLSPAVAAAAADVPVLGGLFQVLTVRGYNEVQDGIHYRISVPRIDAGGAMAKEVNAEIQKRVDAHLKDCRQLWEEYREAFLATGGTEAELADRTMDIRVDYAIKSRTDTTVSFMVDLFEGSFSAYDQQYFYNLDLANDRDITLEDLLGEDWVAVCNDAIRARIAAETDKDGFSNYFPAGQGGFVTVDADTSFYIRPDGVPVVVFPKYAIAAGAAGSPEFPIEK